MGHCTRHQLYNYCPCTTVGPQPAYARSPELIHKCGGHCTHIMLWPLHPELLPTCRVTAPTSCLYTWSHWPALGSTTYTWGHCTQFASYTWGPLHLAMLRTCGATAPSNASSMWGPLHPAMLPTCGSTVPRNASCPWGHCTQ